MNVESEHRRIVKRLRALRATAGARQAEVASAVEISRSHYANLERGRGNVSLRLLLQLARFHGLALHELVR